jgi:hypothetical protein
LGTLSNPKSLDADCRGEKKWILNIIAEHYDQAKHDSMKNSKPSSLSAKKPPHATISRGSTSVKLLPVGITTAKFIDVLARGKYKLFNKLSIH